MSNKKELDIRTQLVHAGERAAWPTGLPVATPIYSSATFTYDSMEEMDEVFVGEKQGFIYTRYGNPTTAALEDAINTLELGHAACAYSTGMAAIHATLLACDLAPGAVVLASQDLYGATTGLLNKVFGAFAVKTTTVDFADLDLVRQTARETKPVVIIAETISNPLLKVCDIEACATIAREVGARLIIDNTFATPYLCQPLTHGADFVVHSATKFLGGHADVMGGLAVVREAADVTALISIMKLVGGVLGVWEAHEILRGLKTLAVRLDRQCANAQRLAGHLKDHAAVARVYYPGFAGAETEERIKRIFRIPSAGALVSLELRENTREAAFHFMNRLRLCLRSTSLGDVFTSVLHPATASHRDVSPAQRQKWGISEGLVRVSVGIEDAEDIIADMEQALAAD
ncbi:MAG: cystathionine gamma-synthase [Acidobacteriota bacterium]|jgi:cystathionine gamma-synthase/methionine-gamma-lyase|nr:cystathionine gamma-synthase [Acidobacteriota bacterium]